MAVLKPLKMILTGLTTTTTKDAGSITGSNYVLCTVPDFPFDPSRGSHTISIEKEIYIDQSDFRIEDSQVGTVYCGIE